jgi:DNA-binding NarL/FixJ family response regulator
VTDRITVLLVDDQQLVRTGFRMILADEGDIDVVGEAKDGSQAVDLAGRLNPDVVVMDIRMPVMDGVEATRRIVAAAGIGAGSSSSRPSTPTSTSSRRCGPGRAASCSRTSRRTTSGTRSGRSPAATRCWRRRSPASSSTGSATGCPLPPATRTRGLLELTDRELEVLKLVARGLSNREIAERLVLAEPTVKTHVSHMLLKLDLRDRAQAVVLAYEAASSGQGSPDD